MAGVDTAGGPAAESLEHPAPTKMDSELVRATEELLAISYLLGRDHVGTRLELADEEPPAIPFEEAVMFMRARVPLTKGEWSRLEPQLRFRAFTVAALSGPDAIDRVRRMATAAIEEGKPLAEFWTAASAEGAAGLGEAPWYWETVYRTNIQTAYNAGRAAEFARVQPEYLEFIGIEDGRQTEICAARSGVVLPATHPFWKTNWPPLHFKCRSTVRSVSQEEVDLVREENSEWSPTDEASLTKEPPGKGFGSNPIDTGSFYKLTPKMLERAEAYGLRGLIEEHAASLGIKDFKLPTTRGRRTTVPPQPTTQTAPVEPLAQPLPEPPSAPTPKDKLKVPEFKTAKEASIWVVKSGLADACSFKGCDVKIVQPWVERLKETIAENPTIRAKMQFFGTAQERNRMLAKIIEEKEYSRYVSAGIDPTKSRSIAKSRAKSIVARWRTPADAIAQYCSTDGVRGIAVNERYAGSAKLFLAQRRDDILHGWKPAGTETLTATFDHEIGHLLDDLSDLSASNELRSYHSALGREAIKAGLSEYATKSIREFVAEAWSEYRASNAPREIARRVAAMLAARLEDAR